MGEDVAKIIQDVYQERYGPDLKKCAYHVASDTTPAAANVADFLDALQNNCEMHIINLKLDYLLDVKEHTRTQTVTAADGNNGKNTAIVIPGGDFKHRGCIVKQGIAVFSFLAHRQREIITLGLYAPT